MLKVLKEALLLLLLFFFLVPWNYEQNMVQMEQKMIQMEKSMQGNKKHVWEQKNVPIGENEVPKRLMRAKCYFLDYVAHYGIELPCLLCMALWGLVWPCVVFLALCALVWPCVLLYGLLMALNDLLWQSTVFSRGQRSKLI